MDTPGRAHGDCATCEIAANFALGRFSRVDTKACSDCQDEGRPEKHRLLMKLDELGTRNTEEVERNLTEFEGSVPMGPLRTQLKRLHGAKPS